MPLVVCKLDRLGRTVKQLVGLVEELEGKDINFKSLKDNIDTSSSAGRSFFHPMASLAQMERELRADTFLPQKSLSGKLGEHFLAARTAHAWLNGIDSGFLLGWKISNASWTGWARCPQFWCSAGRELWLV